MSDFDVIVLGGGAPGEHCAAAVAASRGLVACSLAIQYARRGARVSTVSLGAMKTAVVGASSHVRLAAVHALGQNREIAVVDGMHHLDRTSFVTGETRHVYGGQLAGHEEPRGPSPSTPRERQSSDAL